MIWTREQAKTLIDRALSLSKAEATFVVLNGSDRGNLRFARNTATTAGTSSRYSLAITASFGNTLQVGVPLVAGVFGESGLAVHITVVSLHALTLLTVATVLVEMDLARHTAGGASLGRTVATTIRNTVIHPVVLPVLCGFAWHLTGLPLPTVLDEVLQMLALAPVARARLGLGLLKDMLLGRSF